MKTKDEIKNEEPLCFGTYVGENDVLCGKCCEDTKQKCIKKTNSISF